MHVMMSWSLMSIIFIQYDKDETHVGKLDISFIVIIKIVSRSSFSTMYLETNYTITFACQCKILCKIKTKDENWKENANDKIKNNLTLGRTKKDRHNRGPIIWSVISKGQMSKANIIPNVRKKKSLIYMF